MSTPEQAKAKESAVILTPEESAALEVGLRNEATDRIYSMEEAFEFVKKRRMEWMQTPEATKP